MPAPIPVPLRQAIFQRWQKGASVPSLAAEFRLSQRTLRHLVRRLHQRGSDGFLPDYGHGASRQLPMDHPAFPKVVAMREQHPTWGAGLIRVMLQEASVVAPSERTLQRWLRQTTHAPAPPGRRPSSDDRRARKPHDVWQMDAADQMSLAGERRASWLRLVDECSGAVLQTTIFPPRVLEPRGTQRGATSLAHGV